MIAPDLDGPDIDQALLARLRVIGAPFAHRPLRVAAPSFRAYAADDAPCAGGGAFPSFSITSAACALGCAHCGGRILAPMRPAGRPDAFAAEIRRLAGAGRLRGFLLSGGSDRRNEVRFEPFLPALRDLKRDFPALEIAVHTGLVDARRAEGLAAAGVDAALIDIIGDDATIREVYRLDRPVADFAASLRHLAAAGLRVVPHIVAGLHFGRLRGEWAALDIIADVPTEAVIIVVLMPHLAEAGFVTPDPSAVGGFLGAARARLADRDLILGCARPPGRPRALLDLYALAAGLDVIAHPAQGIATQARAWGRLVIGTGACCGLPNRPGRATMDALQGTHA